VNRIALAMLVVLVGCTDDTDPQWQLDHDRIIAVRATPPRILSGERSELDALVGRKGDHPIELVPPQATVVSPPSLAGALTFEANQWVVTAPSEAQLEAARTELGLEAGAAVPLTVGVAFTAATFPSGTEPEAAIKVVWLGESAANPVLDTAMVNGLAAATTPDLVVGPVVDVPLAVEAIDTDDVNWLTSCGTMHDFDLPAAYLRVEPDDPQAGDLAVVIRTQLGGVAWHVWPIHVE
jgi:hypothetical protein